MKKLKYLLLAIVACCDIQAPPKPKTSRQLKQEAAARRAAAAIEKKTKKDLKANEVALAAAARRESQLQAARTMALMASRPALGVACCDHVEMDINFEHTNPVIADIACKGMELGGPASNPMSERIFYIIGALNPFAPGAEVLKCAPTWREIECTLGVASLALETCLFRLRALCSDSLYAAHATRLKGDFLALLKSLVAHIQAVEKIGRERDDKEWRIAQQLAIFFGMFFECVDDSFCCEGPLVEIIPPLLRCLALVHTTTFYVVPGIFPAHTAVRIEEGFAQFQRDTDHLFGLVDAENVRRKHEEADKKRVLHERAARARQHAMNRQKKLDCEREQRELGAMYLRDERSHDRLLQAQEEKLLRDQKIRQERKERREKRIAAAREEARRVKVENARRLAEETSLEEEARGQLKSENDIIDDMLRLPPDVFASSLEKPFYSGEPVAGDIDWYKRLFGPEPLEHVEETSRGSVGVKKCEESSLVAWYEQPKVRAAAPFVPGGARSSDSGSSCDDSSGEEKSDDLAACGGGGCGHA